MNKVFKLFSASIIFLFCDVACAGVGLLSDVTVKSVGMTMLGDTNSIMEVDLNESVVLSGCSAAYTSKTLLVWAQPAPDAWSNAWMMLLMSAQAQEMKVKISYDCDDIFGPKIRSVNIYR